ncbi:MAG: DUF4339 domain-containing protein [Planctomycetaceae bacterium]|nr:DUF4339 domain-containing protein [Planctomycetaceae bacterium]
MATPKRCPDCRQQFESAVWFFHEMGSDFGPFTRDYMRRLAGDSQISRETLVRSSDSSEWVVADSLDWLQGEFPSQVSADAFDDLSEATVEDVIEVEHSVGSEFIDEHAIESMPPDSPTYRSMTAFIGNGVVAKH